MKIPIFFRLITTRRALLLLSILLISLIGFAQAAGDYRSAAGGGNWSALGSWQRYTGAVWAVPTVLQGYPGQNVVPGVVTVRFFSPITLDVSPANSIGSLSIGFLGNLSTAGNPNLSVTGNLQIGIVGSVTFDGTGNLTVGGTTVIGTAGSFSDNNGTGISTFTGLVSLSPGASWTSTAITATGNLVFQGGISNNSATFSGGGATFNTNSQVLTGAFSFANVVRATGITVTNNGTVTMSDTAAGVLTGTGTWTQGVAGSLNYAGSTIAISTFAASGAGNTITYNGPVQQTIPAIAYQNLILNNTSGTVPQLTLTGNVTVNNTLTMTSGIVNLSGFTFTLGTAGAASTLSRTASATTNWFYGGTLKREWLGATAITSNSGNYYGLFPMGESTASSYSPFEINTTANPTANGSFSVLYTPVPFIGTDLSPFCNDGGTNVEFIVNSGFTTSVSGITGGTYNVDLTMTGVNPIGALSDMRLVTFTGGSTASAVGTHAAATGSVINPTAKRTGLFIADLNTKDFRLGTSNKGATPLPVEFLSLEAMSNGEVVDVTWSTAAEFNSDYFIVQRSPDGNTFQDVIKIGAAGNSSTIQNYYTIDTEPINGVSYYRLKQVDFDGEFMYSNVVDVNFTESARFSIYPNPVSSEAYVHFNLEEQAQVKIEILDVLGKQVKIVANETLSAGFNKQRITLENLESGIYFCKMSSGNITLSEKIVVVK